MWDALARPGVACIGTAQLGDQLCDWRWRSGRARMRAGNGYGASAWFERQVARAALSCSTRMCGAGACEADARAGGRPAGRAAAPTEGGVKTRRAPARRRVDFLRAIGPSLPASGQYQTTAHLHRPCLRAMTHRGAGAWQSPSIPAAGPGRGGGGGGRHSGRIARLHGAAAGRPSRPAIAAVLDDKVGAAAGRPSRLWPSTPPRR